MKHGTFHSYSRQRGAALIIGLLLLVVLTLLAVTGMNTASTELVMAGNEQFQQRAFQAAQTGIEQGLKALRTPAGPGTTTGASVSVPLTTVPNTTTDQYTTTSEYMGPGSIVSGYSTGKYTFYQFQITSTGRSSRNSQIRNVQGAFTVQSNGG